MVCPLCGSEEISKPRISQMALGISALVGFPIPFLGKTVRCFDCGKEFKWRNNKIELD